MTTFFEIFQNLCKANGTTPSSVAKALKLSTAKPTNWKNGAQPSADHLVLIADYFGVSVDYLLGHEVKKSVMERPTSEIAENFIRENMELLKEKPYNEFTKLYKLLNDMQKVYAVAYLIGYMQHEGIDTSSIGF